MELTSKTLSVDTDIESAYESLYREGVTDGLPVIPPTKSRVEDMLGGSQRDAGEILGKIPPKYGVATVEKIAVNAVLAGCKPEYMPVLETAIEAMTEEEFNLYGINATTHPVAPLLIINGPIIDELNINYGYNVFGQGWRANATIGRAIRLLLLNVGGGEPGDMDRATHGHPGKYSYCIAENEKRTPWEPFHVSKGFDENESTVTAIGVEAPHEINDHVHGTADGILTVAADVFATVGNNNTHNTDSEICLVMGPEHAETVAGHDWTRKDVQWFLYDQARNSVEKLQDAGIPENYSRHHRFETETHDAMVPLVEDPEDVLVVVAGGAGKHSMALHTFGGVRSVTKKIGD